MTLSMKSNHLFVKYPDYLLLTVTVGDTGAMTHALILITPFHYKNTVFKFNKTKVFIV